MPNNPSTSATPNNPLTPAQEKTDKIKKKSIEDWNRNSFSAAYRKNIKEKNVQDSVLNSAANFPFKSDERPRISNFIKLDKTKEDIAEEERLSAKAGGLSTVNGSKLFGPGLYKTDPDSFYHILCEDSGTPPRRVVKPLFGSDKDLFRETNYKNIREAYGATIDFIVLDSKSRSVTFDWDEPSAVDPFHLLNSMHAALDRGVEFEFGKNTRIAMQTWSKKDREEFVAFQQGINAHAAKYQALIDFGEKFYQKAAKDINDTNAKAKLDPDNDKARKALFGDEKEIVSKESLDGIGKHIADATERLEKLKNMNGELAKKVNATSDLLANPNALETKVIAPKEKGFTGAQVALNTLALLGLPHAIYRAFSSTVEEAKAGKMDSEAYLKKVESNWIGSDPARNAFIDSIENELNDLTRTQALVEEEIRRLSGMDDTKLRDVDAKLSEIKLGERDPAKREELERTKEDLQHQKDQMSGGPAAQAHAAKVMEKNAEQGALNTRVEQNTAAINDVTARLTTARATGNNAAVPGLLAEERELKEEKGRLQTDLAQVKKEAAELDNKSLAGLDRSIAEVKAKLGETRPKERAELESKEKELLAKKEGAASTPEQKKQNAEQLKDLKDKSKTLQEAIGEQKKSLNDAKEAVKNMPDKISEKVEDNKTKLGKNP